MTQNQRILKYMDDFGSISTLEAFKELGVTRLASRIHEISKAYPIKKQTETSMNRYGEPVHYTRYYREVSA